MHRTPLLIPGPRSGIARLLAGIVCAVAVLPVFADEVYRWVDAEGRVHYGDTPPDNAERVELAPAPAGDPQLQQRRERGERLLDIMEEDRRRRDDEQRAGAQVDAERRSKCERARQRSTRAAAANYIYQSTSDPDNPHILSEEERQRFDQQLQAEIRRYCGGAEVAE